MGLGGPVPRPGRPRLRRPRSHRANAAEYARGGVCRHHRRTPGRRPLRQLRVQWDGPLRWHPTQLLGWGARRDAGLQVGTGYACAPTCRGSVPEVFLHSVALSPDGRTAYLSYWDLGVIVLDVSEPNAPRWLGRYAEPAVAEG